MPSPKFHIQTFGCQMNVNDSDWLSRALKSRGFEEVPFEEASFHILNTCSVREKPEQKIYSELGRIAHFFKRQGRSDIIACVGGCVAQQVGAKLRNRFPQVRLVFGTDGIVRVPDAMEKLLDNPRLKLNLLDFEDQYEEREEAWPDGEYPPVAFVNIMQGCNNFCTYCIVPYVRGRQKSRDSEAVLQECKAFLAKGAREITLLGQNVNSYGQDLDGDTPTFAELLYAVSELEGLERLRFVTSHPKDIAPEVIEAFKEIPKLCPSLHLPLQSGSDRILKAMGRKYDIKKYMGIVEKLKKVRPEMIFTTDIIVGFPGERDEDFQNTLKIMKDVGFASSFSFVYSDRPMTKANLLPDKIDRSLALERLLELQSWQKEHSKKVLASFIGRTEEVLLENKSLRKPLPDDGLPIDETKPIELPKGWDSWQGRTGSGFIVNLSLPTFKEVENCSRKNWTGSILPVEIEAAARHSLKGKIVGNPW